jgi:isoleucyl-tRNA synthetase
MHRVEDIFDVWFDSAVASWATLWFPSKKEAMERLWPADFITDAFMKRVNSDPKLREFANRTK